MACDMQTIRRKDDRIDNDSKPEWMKEENIDL